MSQQDFSIANMTRTLFRQTIVLALKALASNNSGATEPTDTYPYMLWADTTTGLLKQRNAADDGWITIGTMASTNLGLLSLAGGNMTGAINGAAFSVAAHATTCDIWAGGDSCTLTGSAVTFTDVADAPQAGAVRRVYCNAAHVFTDNGNLDVAGGTFTAEAGDWVDFYAVTTTTFKLTPFKGDGTAVVESAGRLVQRVEATPYNTYSSTTTIIPNDDSIPQSTEGVQYLSAAITPKKTTNRLIITATFYASSDAARTVSAALFNGGANALAAAQATTGAINNIVAIPMRYEMEAGSTSQITFTLRAGPAGGTMYVNGSSSSRNLGGVLAATLSVEEYE